MRKRELIECLPALGGKFRGWSGTSVLVTESEYKRITVEAERQGRYYAAKGPYLDYWQVWLGSVPKASRAKCGAKTRKGTPCQCLPVAGKERCKYHGGASTGPKTAEGRARIAESNRRRARAKLEAEEATSIP